MYRKQMKFQKLICLLMLAASALVFIYSLGLSTDLYDAFFYAIPRYQNLNRTDVEGARVYYDNQPFNKALTTASLVLIGCSLLTFITNTHSRRKYYLSNYITASVYTLASIVISIWSAINISKFKTQFLTTVDFEQFKKFAEISPSTQYTESTFWFDIGYVVLALLLIVSAINIFNLIWKTKLMKEEARLIKEGLEE